MKMMGGQSGCKIEVVVKVGGQFEVAMCDNGSGGQNG